MGVAFTWPKLKQPSPNNLHQPTPDPHHHTCTHHTAPHSSSSLLHVLTSGKQVATHSSSPASIVALDILASHTSRESTMDICRWNGAHSSATSAVCKCSFEVGWAVLQFAVRKTFSLPLLLVLTEEGHEDLSQWQHPFRKPVCSAY